MTSKRSFATCSVAKKTGIIKWCAALLGVLRKPRLGTQLPEAPQFAGWAARVAQAACYAEKPDLQGEDLREDFVGSAESGELALPDVEAVPAETESLLVTTG